jgi:hypothetical protein
VDDVQQRRAGWRFILWLALGTALAATTAWAVVMAILSSHAPVLNQLRSLGLTKEEAGRAAAHVHHDLRLQMLWTALLASLLFGCWVAATRQTRSRRPPLAPESRKGRTGLGVLIGILGYGIVAFPLVAAGNRLV